jgi:hypothetical protein
MPAMTPPLDATGTNITDYRNHRIDDLLKQGVRAINKLATCFRENQNMAAVIRQLRDAMCVAQDRRKTPIPAKEQFRLIYPFTSWFTRNAAASFIDVSKRDPLVFLFIAYLYAVTIALVVALPAVDYPFFASMRIRGIFAIRSEIGEERAFICASCGVFHCYDEMMRFPLDAVEAYQSLYSSELDLI